MSEEQMPKNYKLLKGIVITLGILIIAMVIILVVASVNKYNDQKRAEAALVDKYQASQSAKPLGSSPFELDLVLEAGQEILSTSANSQGIIVTIGEAGVAKKILVIGLDGKITGTINIK